MHTRAPQGYEATVANYFALATPDTPPKHLVFGSPTLSDCTLFAPGGRHLSWVVPVVDDRGQQGHVPTPRPPDRRQALSGHAGSNEDPVPLDEVSIRGKRYFFWFSSDTIGAVTRDSHRCP